jgi:hypothetical protein
MFYLLAALVKAHRARRNVESIECVKILILLYFIRLFYVQNARDRVPPGRALQTPKVIHKVIHSFCGLPNFFCNFPEGFSQNDSLA